MRKISSILIVLWMVPSLVALAANPSDSDSKSKQKLQMSPSIIPLPHQTIQNAGLNRGLHQSFCENFNLVSEIKECASLGCFQEVVKDNRQTNLLPAQVPCYSCVQLSKDASCCPGMPVYADRMKGESCSAKTGIDCSENRSCEFTCPKDSQVVPGTSLDREVECCKCSSIASDKCDDHGQDRPLVCAEGDLSDLRFDAVNPTDCNSVAIRNGGQCLPKCQGEGIECGAAH